MCESRTLCTQQLPACPYVATAWLHNTTHSLGRERLEGAQQGLLKTRVACLALVQRGKGSLGAAVEMVRNASSERGYLCSCSYPNTWTGTAGSAGGVTALELLSIRKQLPHGVELCATGVECAAGAITWEVLVTTTESIPAGEWEEMGIALAGKLGTQSGKSDVIIRVAGDRRAEEAAVARFKGLEEECGYARSVRIGDVTSVERLLEAARGAVPRART